MNNNDRLVLKDGTEIQIENSSSLSDIKVISQTKEEMIYKWDLLTAVNLSKVEIQNKDGETIGEYKNLILDSETSKIQSDGTILTSFNLREKTEVELLREELNAVREEVDVQGEAISEVGTVLNELTGGI